MSADETPVEMVVGELLRTRGWSLGLAETALGGLVSARLTAVPGCSAYFKGAVVAYDDAVKVHLLGASRQTIERHGAVSAEVAGELAEGVRRALRCDVALAETGIAGPGGARPGKPVGLFYLAVAAPQTTLQVEQRFPGDREPVRRQAAAAALELLRSTLRSIPAEVLAERHVVTAFLERHGQILLLRRSGQVGTYQGQWAGVSGSLDPGRSPLDQALREIAEETGLAVNQVQLMRVGEPVEVVDREIARRWIVHPFRFAVAEDARVQLDWEHLEARWVDPLEIVDLPTVPGLAAVWQRVAGNR